MYMKYTPNMVPRSAFHYVLLLFGTGWFHPSQWRYNEHHSVSNHRHLDCLPKRLFRRILNKTSKLSVTGFCEQNPPVPMDSPHKGPVTRDMFPFDDVHMCHRGNLTVASAKQFWRIWTEASHKSTRSEMITTTKQTITKPFAYSKLRNGLPSGRPLGQG